jgi:alkylglycerol monooxygenase
LKPPGWRPTDVAARWPKAPFVIEELERFDPVSSPGRKALALSLFLALLAATTFFLWHAHALGWPERGAFALAVILGLYGVGRLGEPMSGVPIDNFAAGGVPSRAPPQATP